MLNLFYVEFKKFIKRKKFYIPCILIILLTTFFVSASIYVKENIELKKDKNLYLNSLKEKRKMALEDGTSPNVIKTYDLFIKDAERESYMKDKFKNPNINWKVKIKDDINYSKEKIERYSTALDIKEKENANIMLKEYHLKNEVPYEYTNTNLDFTFFKAIPSLINQLGVCGLYVLISLMITDVINGENKPATIKFLLTKPIKRKNIFWGKFITSVVTINLLVLSFELIAGVVFGKFYGFSNSSYPTLYGTQYTTIAHYEVNDSINAIMPILNSTKLINNSTFLFRCLILQILFITALISFCLLCSVLIKNSNNACAITVLITGIFTLTYSMKISNAYNKNPGSLISKLLPFLFPIYLSPEDILTGKINMYLKVDFITYKFVIIILIFWILLCYVFGSIIFAKRDITA